MSDRRSWLSFRLRSLLLFTLLCSIVFAVALYCYVEPYRREWRINREIKRLPHPASVVMQPDAPAWLRPFGAERYMQRIIAVKFDDGDDDSMALLADLPALQTLEVRSPKATDGSLRHIEKCKSLELLALDCPQITDAGLRSLANLRALHSLTLKTPLVTDAGLKNLSHLKELRNLEIDAPNVGDDGLEHVAGLALWRLTVIASVSDRGLAHLVNRRKLPWSPGQYAGRQGIVCIRPGNKDIVSVLMENTEAAFQDQPLCDALEYIHYRHNISINSSNSELERAGIDPLQPVTIKTPNAPGYTLYDLLNSTLPPLGLDWRIGSDSELEVLPSKTLTPQRPHLLKLRADWPQCPVIVDW